MDEHHVWTPGHITSTDTQYRATTALKTASTRTQSGPRWNVLEFLIPYTRLVTRFPLHPYGTRKAPFGYNRTLVPIKQIEQWASHGPQ